MARSMQVQAPTLLLKSHLRGLLLEKSLTDFCALKKQYIIFARCNLVNTMILLCKVSGTGKSLSEALLFAEHWGEHVVYKNCSECHETISVQNMFSPGLSLEFSCIELVIQ